MWLAATETGELATALIPAVWAFLGIVVTALVTIYVQGRRDRSEERRAALQPVPVNGNGNGTTHLMSVARDLGALVQRADDNDDRDDLQDHELRGQRQELDGHSERLTALERYHDRRDPGWRER